MLHTWIWEFSLSPENMNEANKSIFKKYKEIEIQNILYFMLCVILKFNLPSFKRIFQETTF